MSGKQLKKRRFNEQQVRSILLQFSLGRTFTELAKMFGASRATMRRVVQTGYVE